MIGGPLVEAARDDLKLTVPLKGITTAVVGVILNLEVFYCLARSLATKFYWAFRYICRINRHSRFLTVV